MTVNDAVRKTRISSNVRLFLMFIYVIRVFSVVKEFLSKFLDQTKLSVSQIFLTSARYVYLCL